MAALVVVVVVGAGAYWELEPSSDDDPNEFEYDPEFEPELLPDAPLEPPLLPGA